MLSRLFRQNGKPRLNKRRQHHYLLNRNLHPLAVETLEVLLKLLALVEEEFTVSFYLSFPNWSHCI